MKKLLTVAAVAFALSTAPVHAADKVGSVAKQNFAVLFDGENADAVSVSLKMSALLDA